MARWMVVLAMLPTFAFAQTRVVPERMIGVPQEDVSPAMQKIIAAAPSTPTAPATLEQWQARRAAITAVRVKELPGLRDRLGVTVQTTTIAGVPCYWVTPRDLPSQNEHRLLVHVHGGYYVFNNGEAALREAVLMAGFAHMKVLSVDYRLAPEDPFPAGLDDAITVWKTVLQTNQPKNMAVFGTSAGGGMTLALMLRAKQEGLPLPAAISANTPAADQSGGALCAASSGWLLL
jgi:epsilon-lactone hydrolase